LWQYQHTRSLYSVDEFQCIKMIYNTFFVKCLSILHYKFVHFVHLWLVPHPTAFMTYRFMECVCMCARACVYIYICTYVLCSGWCGIQSYWQYKIFWKSTVFHQYYSYTNIVLDSLKILRINTDLLQWIYNAACTSTNQFTANPSQLHKLRSWKISRTVKLWSYITGKMALGEPKPTSSSL
jgi:hypothetical protein